MTDRPEFLRGPFDVVAELIAAACNPNATPEARAQACDRLKSLSTAFLRGLSLDEEWKFVLSSLSRDEMAGDVPGDGVWSAPDPLEVTGTTDSVPAQAAAAPPPVPPTTPAEQPLLRPILGRYGVDLSTMSSDDHLPLLGIVLTPPDAGADPMTRVAACAKIQFPHPIPSEAYVRALPWGMLGYGAGLMYLCDAWPDRPAVHEAFWHEVMQRQAHRGLPWRLAQRILQIVGTDGARRAWFDGIATEVESYVHQELFDFLTIDDVAERHFATRLLVAEAVRRAEVTEPELIGAAELYATTYLVRYAAYLDCQRAWRDAHGHPLTATALYQERDMADEMFYVVAFKAAMRQASTHITAALAPRQRQVMTLMRNLQSRGSIAGSIGFLSRES